MAGNNSPLIGITSDLKDKHTSIEESYSAALIKYGGLPVLIPTVSAERGYLKQIVGRLDGLLIPGSRDMDPKYYNEEPHPLINPMSPERTETEYLVTEYAIARGIPVLGICGGMQFLNVYFGGSLHQDIRSILKNAMDHEKGAVHEVEIMDGTVLSGIISDRKFSVKSYHHQGVNRVGTGLRVNAVSPDGMVEGIETESGSVIGIQWHPELEDTGQSRRIFGSFVSACTR